MPPTTLLQDIQQTAQTSQTGKAAAGYAGMLNLSWGYIIAGLIFSGLGLVYLRYGKVNGHISMMVCGVLLMIVPFFISNVWYLSAACAALAVYPHLK